MATYEIRGVKVSGDGEGFTRAQAWQVLKKVRRAILELTNDQPELEDYDLYEVEVNRDGDLWHVDFWQKSIVHGERVYDASEIEEERDGNV